MEQVYLTANQIEVVHCSAEERETTISMTWEDKIAHIYTTENTFLTRVKKLMTAEPTKWKVWEAGRTKSGPTGYFIETAYRNIVARNPKKISDERRAAASERFRKMHATHADEIDDEDEEA